MYFRQNVKPPRFRISLYQETFSSVLVNNFVTVHAFYVYKDAFSDVLGNVVVYCFVEFGIVELS